MGNFKRVIRAIKPKDGKRSGRYALQDSRIAGGRLVQKEIVFFRSSDGTVL